MAISEEEKVKLEEINVEIVEMHDVKNYVMLIQKNIEMKQLDAKKNKANGCCH